MAESELEDLQEYGNRLRAYSTADLEDIYFKIHILRHPLRYRLIRMELERRKVLPEGESSRRAARTLCAEINALPFLENRGLLSEFVCALVAAGAGLMGAGAVFACIWVFAVPLKFLGLESTIVYICSLPVVVVAGMGLGLRIGARSKLLIAVAVGVAVAAVLFGFTSAPLAIWRSVTEPQGGSGFSFGGF